MARAPFQVLVLLFRRTQGGIEYGVLRRSDDGAWQGVAGGGEDDETIVTAAQRELMEETGVSALLYQLEMRDFVRVDCFEARDEWPPDTYLVPQYFFACDATGAGIRLSPEHTEMKWASYDEVHALLRYDSNRTALWELAQRLGANDLVPASDQ